MNMSKNLLAKHLDSRELGTGGGWPQPVAGVHLRVNEVLGSCPLKELAESSHCCNVIALLALPHSLCIQSSQRPLDEAWISLEAQAHRLIHLVSHLQCTETIHTNLSTVWLCGALVIIE